MKKIYSNMMKTFCFVMESETSEKDMRKITLFLKLGVSLTSVGPPVPLFAEPGFSSVEDGEHSVPPRMWTERARLVKVGWVVEDEGVLDELFPERAPSRVLAPLGCDD